MKKFIFFLKYLKAFFNKENSYELWMQRQQLEKDVERQIERLSKIKKANAKIISKYSSKKSFQKTGSNEK